MAVFSECAGLHDFKRRTRSGGLPSRAKPTTKKGTKSAYCSTYPDSEHWLDWFHITMRITALQQQVKTLKDEPQDRRGSGASVGEHQTFPLARQHVPSAAAIRKPPYRSGVSRGSLATDAEGGQGYRRIRNLHPQQLLLQTRTKVLNYELEEVFRRWYPRFRSAA